MKKNIYINKSMKSKTFFLYSLYILPFFLIFNKATAMIITVFTLCYMVNKTFKIKSEFLKYVKENKNYIYPLIIFNAYLIFNTLIISNSYSQSIGRLLVFIIFSSYLVFFQFFIKFYIFDFDYKKISLFFLIALFFVIFDTYIQFLFRTDLLGFEIITFRLSGPFGDEKIVGAFLFKFMFFGIYFILNNKYLKKFILLFIGLCLTIIILSGERVAGLYGIFFITLFIIFNFRSYISLNQFLVLLLFIFISLFQFYKVAKDSNIINYMSPNNINISNDPLANYKPSSRLDEITIQILNRYTRNIMSDLNTKDSSYFKLFKSGLMVWQDDKIFGVGLKNYRIKCKELKLENKYECSSHPHNLFIELLSELGVVGLVLFCYAIFTNIFKFIKNSKVPYYIIFSLSPSLIPLVNTSFFNSFSILIFLYQIILLSIISNHK